MFGMLAAVDTGGTSEDPAVYVVDAPAIGERGWLLRLVSRLGDAAAWQLASRHARRTDAEAWGLHHDMVDRRRVKVLRHQVVASLALVAAFVIFYMLAIVVPPNGVAWFSGALALVVVGLREIGMLLELLVGESDERYRPQPMTTVDRMVIGLVERIRTTNLEVDPHPELVRIVAISDDDPDHEKESHGGTIRRART